MRREDHQLPPWQPPFRQQEQRHVSALNLHTLLLSCLTWIIGVAITAVIVYGVMVALTTFGLVTP